MDTPYALYVVDNIKFRSLGSARGVPERRWIAPGFLPQRATRLSDRAGLAQAHVVVFDRQGRALLDVPGFMPDWMPPWP